MNWQDVQDHVGTLFTVWMSGREDEWAQLAWEGLQKAGLTNYEDEVGRTLVLIWLMGLAVLYREFCATAWDEWAEPELEDWLCDLDLNEFRIAQLVGPEFEKDSELTQAELVQSAVLELIEREREALVKALLDYFGGKSMLFASLWATLSVFQFDSLDEEDDWAVGEDEDEQAEAEDEESAVAGAQTGAEQKVELFRRTLRELLTMNEVLDEILNNPTDEKLEGFAWVSEGMPSVFH